MTKIHQVIDLINQRLIYDYLQRNTMFFIFYTLVIVVSYPITTIITSYMFADLTTSIQKKSFKKVFKILNRFVIFLFLVGFITKLKNTMEEYLFPNYITYLSNTLRIGTLKSRSENFQEVNIAETITRIQDTIYDLESFLKEFSNKIIPFSLKIICINLYYAYLNPKFGLFSISLDIFRILLLLKISINYRKAVFKKFTEYYNSNRIFSSTFENIFNIHINSQIEKEIQSQCGLNENVEMAIKEQIKSKRNVVQLFSATNLFCFYFKFRYMYSLLVSKKIKQSQFISFVFLEYQYLFDNNDFCYVFLNVIHTYEGLRNGSDELFKMLIEIEDENKPFLNIQNGTIILTNVSYCYNSLLRKCIFTDANYTFNNKGKYILVGKSGSGKTSLIYLLLKLIPVTEGSLMIDNSEISNIPTKQVRQIITMIPQQNILFNNLTMEKNILYGTTTYTQTDILYYLNKYPQLKAILFDDNSDEFLNRIYNGTNASGGQKRIIVNLRGLLRAKELNSFIMILDEPLVGLSEDAAKAMIELIKTEFAEQTVLLIEHELQKNPSYLTLLNQNSSYQYQEVQMENIQTKTPS